VVGRRGSLVAHWLSVPSEPDDAVSGAGARQRQVVPVGGGDALRHAHAPRVDDEFPHLVTIHISAKLAARDQNVRMAISAGAASNSAISWSRRLNVMDVPAISRDVQ